MNRSTHAIQPAVDRFKDFGIRRAVSSAGFRDACTSRSIRVLRVSMTTHLAGKHTRFLTVRTGATIYGRALATRPTRDEAPDRVPMGIDLWSRDSWTETSWAGSYMLRSRPKGPEGPTDGDLPPVPPVETSVTIYLEGRTAKADPAQVVTIWCEITRPGRASRTLRHRLDCLRRFSSLHDAA